MKTLLSAGLTALTAFTLAAQTIELRPGANGIKDSYIWQEANYTHDNWGELYALRELLDIGVPRSTILIQFQDLSPITQPIEFASLHLYRYDADGSGLPVTLDLVRVLSDWPENVTFSTAPTLSLTPLASVTVSGTSPGWYEWEITSVMQDWLANSTSNFGLALVASGEGYFQRFVSSDNLTATQPQNILPPRDPLLQPFIRARYVPEPTATALAGLGLLLFHALRRRPRS